MQFCQRFIALLLGGIVLLSGASTGCTTEAMEDPGYAADPQASSVCLQGGDPVSTGACVVAVAVTAAEVSAALAASSGVVTTAAAALVAAAPVILAVVAVTALVAGVGILIFTVNNTPQYYAVGLMPPVPVAAPVPPIAPEAWAGGSWGASQVVNNSWVLQAQIVDIPDVEIEAVPYVPPMTQRCQGNSPFWKGLQKELHDACHRNRRACRGTDSCTDMLASSQSLLRCFVARENMQRYCYGGLGDANHVGEMEAVRNSIAKCNKFACAQYGRASCPSCSGNMGQSTIPVGPATPSCADRQNFCYTNGLFEAAPTGSTCTDAGTKLSGSDDQSGWLCENRTNVKEWTGCFVKSAGNIERASNQWQQGYSRVASPNEIKSGLDPNSCWQCQPLADYPHVRQWMPVGREYCGTVAPGPSLCTEEGKITESVPRSQGCGRGARTEGQFTDCYRNQYTDGVRYQCVRDPSNASNVAWKRDCGCNGF